MGFDCVIEGVETADEMATLKDLGSLMVQDYYYSPPISEVEIIGFLDRPNSENISG